MIRKPKRTIIYVVDGLSYKAIDRLRLPNMKGLMREGSYFKECYFLPTAHPRGWFHTCSLGNIALVTGTIFFRLGAEQIQQMFKPSYEEIRQQVQETGLTLAEVRDMVGVTAHFAGAGNAYQSISVGYDYVTIGRYNDDEVVGHAIEFLANEPNLVFMLMHLQDLGGAGGAIRQSKTIRSIWAEGSRYPAVAEHADKLLGKLIDMLKSTGDWADTVMVVTADHGQADTGWHPPFVQDSWRAPLIVKGPGVKAGIEFPYAEVIDVTPTICKVAGVRTPSDAIGIVLNKMLISPEARPQRRGTTLKELDETMKKYVDFREKLIRTVKGEGRDKLKKLVDEADKEFYSIERLVEWVEAGSVDRLVEADRKAIRILEKAQRQLL